MNIASTPGVQSATAATQSATAGDAQVLVLKKALAAQSQNAVSLIQALPQPLATSGNLGRHLNAVA